MKEIGVAYASGVDVFYATSVNRTFAILCTEGAPGVQSPERVNSVIFDRRDTHHPLKIAVIVEGDLGWLLAYRNAVADADAMIYIGSLADLRAIGVSVVDAEWGADSAAVPQESIEHYISKLRTAVVGPVLRDGEEDLEEVKPPFEVHETLPGEPTEPSADQHGFPEDVTDFATRAAPLDILTQLGDSVASLGLAHFAHESRDALAHVLAASEFHSRSQWRMCFSGAWDGVTEDDCRDIAHRSAPWEDLPEKTGAHSAAVVNDMRHVPNSGEHIGRCRKCRTKFCWSPTEETQTVRRNPLVSMLCPVCGDTIKETTRMGAEVTPFNHLHADQVIGLQERL